ncbi:spore coat protein [Dendrosporobacter sp. 1207_IL3150]|uniref:spore coat protein n=1 Tax=Dendrosporobacter sp. 1207_IL3150 TaxID=3084054 RepID=UPI002FD89E8B
MSVNLSQKERMLLNDQKNHEQVCIQKYQSYASQAQSSELKQLFNSFAQSEQSHLNTINQILSGQVPNIQQGQQGQQQGQQGQQGQQSQKGQQQGNMQSSAANASNNTTSQTAFSQSDAALCSDMLMTEKYVSGAYDTAIFEFADPQIRQVLNHIQKEEQQHGEGLFQYMQNQGMYNVQ